MNDKSNTGYNLGPVVICLLRVAISFKVMLLAEAETKKSTEELTLHLVQKKLLEKQVFLQMTRIMSFS